MQVSEEVRFHLKVMVDRLDLQQTFHQAQLQHGDILLIQHDLPEVPFLAYFAMQLSQPVTHTIMIA